MSPLLKILALLVIAAYVVEACDSRNCGSGCWNGRRKRETTKRVQDILLEFDIRLTEDLASEIKDMDEGEKEQFIQDLEKMNNAVKVEAAAVKANDDGAIQTPEEFLRAVADKVAQDFQGKKWFNRLRSIAGDQIAKIMKQMGGN